MKNILVSHQVAILDLIWHRACSLVEFLTIRIFRHILLRDPALSVQNLFCMALITRCYGPKVCVGVAVYHTCMILNIIIITVVSFRGCSLLR